MSLLKRCGMEGSVSMAHYRTAWDILVPASPGWV